MKIAIAQTRPIKGDVSANIKAHKDLIDLAMTMRASGIFFPELSLTGYEPELAKTLATDQNDSRLDIFQEICDKDEIIICVGLPTNSGINIRISMIVFQPGRSRLTYSKQQLHSDEVRYFENGSGQMIITSGELKIAPAICYESLQPNHAEYAFRLGANVYLASVAKSENGFQKALKHYPEVAKKYSIPVLMSNSVGFCDNFAAVGKSSVWTSNGILAGQLDENTEGLLVFDTETGEVVTKAL